MHAGELAVMAEQCLARSPRGVVAAAAPSAARIGAEMLRAGGNAIDAAVAAALAETVLLPPKCGLAGDLVALVWAPDADEPAALLAIGGAPAGLSAVAERGDLVDTGPFSVGVPGAPSGYLALARRGVLGIERLAAPAIELATDGFCWSTVCTVLSDDALDLVARHQPTGSVYYPGGASIAPGTVTRLPGLAAALGHLVADQDDYLVGPVGEAIVRRVAEAGGVLTMDDLGAAVQRPPAEWVPTAHLEVAGRSMWVTPAPTHGPSLLDVLNRLGGPDGEHDASTGGTGDSGVHGPTASFASPASVVAAIRAAIVERQMALTDPSGTSMVSAVDRSGMLVVVVHSNSYPQFGSGLVAEEFDLILANRAGRGFSSQVGHPNFPVVGRRPATTLHAWGMSTDEGHRLLGATPGGANQMPWNAQTLARLIDTSDGVGGEIGGRDLAMRVAGGVVGPRWQFDATGGSTIEDGFDDADRRELDEALTDVRSTHRWGLRSAMQIVGRVDGVAIAAGDPRTQCGLVAL